MDINFSPYFKKYEALIKTVDDVFLRVKNDYPSCVKCKTACDDCCYAMFDLTLIEALYINHKFKTVFENPDRVKIEERANLADRKIHKIKRSAFNKLEKGATEAAILSELALERVRCPFLNDDQICEMYAFRPATCRLYGIPTAIDGRGYTCGKSGFEQGGAYPTVNMDQLFGRLQEISAEFVLDIKSKYVKLADLLVPLSMALLTDYTEEYLGIKDDAKTGGAGIIR
ncbi:MAG: YkgJ family cysteine cluster protein [Deltaproteobacteria bacterium]|nr:YkgJ family cysteine cluster protein [Deltaproteobacteria bacterium]